MEQIALFVVPVLLVTYLFKLVQSWMDSRVQARTEKVQLLEEALRNPSIDRATIEALAAQLTGVQAKKGGASASMAIVLALGWIALFGGVGVWVLGELLHDPGMQGGGIVTGILGFGLVTYPFALRELEARRAES